MSMRYFCAALCDFASYHGEYLRATFTKLLELLTHLLTVFSALLPSSHCFLLPTVPSLDSYLKPTVLFFPPLSTASLCLLWDPPSLLHFQSPGRCRPQVLCVGFAPKQKIFSDRHTHTPTQRMANIVS